MLVPFRGVMPKIADNVFVAENATVVGDVEVGSASSLWYGAVLRGDHASIRVGEGTSIQDNAVLHVDAGMTLTVGNNCTIGHGAIVHCASVGDNTLIGMGAVALKGAKIGSCCIIAAGAVVKEYAEIPDNSMVVGVPGKIIRTLTDEQAAELRKPAPYIELAAEYLEARQENL